MGKYSTQFHRVNQRFRRNVNHQNAPGIRGQDRVVRNVFICLVSVCSSRPGFTGGRLLRGSHWSPLGHLDSAFSVEPVSQFCNSNHHFETSRGLSSRPAVSLGEQSGDSGGQDSGFSDTLDAQLNNIISTRTYFLCKKLRLGLMRPMFFCVPPPNSCLYPFRGSQWLKTVCASPPGCFCVRVHAGLAGNVLSCASPGRFGGPFKEA